MASAESARGYYLAAGDPIMAAEHVGRPGVAKGRDARRWPNEPRSSTRRATSSSALPVTTERELVRVGLLEVRAMNDLQAGRARRGAAQLAEALELATALGDESTRWTRQYFLDYADGVRARSGGGLATGRRHGPARARRRGTRRRA